MIKSLNWIYSEWIFWNFWIWKFLASVILWLGLEGLRIHGKIRLTSTIENHFKICDKGKGVQKACLNVTLVKTQENTQKVSPIWWFPTNISILQKQMMSIITNQTQTKSSSDRKYRNRRRKRKTLRDYILIWLATKRTSQVNLIQMKGK